MKKMIRRWLNRYKNQRKKNQLVSRARINLDSLVKSCEKIVLEKTGTKVYTKFRDLGGVNNHGMLLHYSVQSLEPVAISKIEESSLAEREYRFLIWQKDYRDNTLGAEPLGLIDVLEPEYSCLVTSVLSHPQVFSYSKAQQLFHALGQQPENVSLLALTGKKEGLKDEINDSTKIKSILVHLVSQFGTDNSEIFYKNFLQEREELFKSHREIFLSLQVLMDDAFTLLKSYDLANYEGLVHGDFKPQNIMRYIDSYRVIDCQYYTYGIRLWDLAFLYSKNEKFYQIEQGIDEFERIEERLFMIYFYLLAIVANAKKKRMAKILPNQLLPGLEYLKKILSILQN